MRFTPLAEPPERRPGLPATRPAPPTTLVWTARRSGVLHRTGEVALSVLAVAGLVCVLALGAVALTDASLLVVRSGSMAPALPVGALAIATPVPASSVEVGDIVSIVRDDSSRVTHRVVATADGPVGLRSLTLRGDANADPDPNPVLVERVDRVVASAPHLGAVAERLRSAPALFALGIATGVGLLWSFGPPTVASVGRWEPEAAWVAGRTRRRGAHRRAGRPQWMVASTAAWQAGAS